MTTIKERYEKGIKHDPRSLEIYRFMEDLDFREGGDSLCLKSGGDGDNGEQLMYLLDCFFEMKDKEPAMSPSCKECKWGFDDLYLNNHAITPTFRGRVYYVTRAGVMRGIGEKCGPTAKLFEPKEEPEP